MIAKPLSTMRFASPFGSIAVVASAALLLASCGDRVSSAQVPSQGAMFDHGGQVLAQPKSSVVTGETLYVSSPNANTVTEYSLPSGTIAGTLTASNGISDPEGMAFAKGHLYIANDTEALIFPRGKTDPSLTLQEPGPSYLAYDIVVDASGTVYLANLVTAYDDPGDVLVYKKGQTTYDYSLNFPCCVAVEGDAIDSSNYLHVSYASSHSSRIMEYAPGSQKGKDTHWHVHDPTGMAFDEKGNLVVVDGGTQIDVFTHGDTEPVRTFGKLSSGQFLAFDKSHMYLYVADSGANQVDEFDYANGVVVKTFPLAGASGVAIDPPASP